MSLRNPSRRAAISAGLALGPLASCRVWADADLLRIGYWDNPPDVVAYPRSGVDGPVRALVDHAAAASGSKVEWRRVTLRKGLEEIGAGRLDALAFVSQVTPDRAQVGWGGNSMGKRSRELHFALRRTDTRSIDRWTDLKDLRIGVVKGRYYTRRFHDDAALNVVGFESETDMAHAMLSGEIDTILTNNRVRLQQQLLQAGFNEIRFAALSAREDQDLMLLNSRRSNAEPALRRLDATLADMRKRGLISEIFIGYGVEPPK